MKPPSKLFALVNLGKYLQVLFSFLNHFDHQRNKGIICELLPNYVPRANGKHRKPPSTDCRRLLKKNCFYSSRNIIQKILKTYLENNKTAQKYNHWNHSGIVFFAHMIAWVHKKGNCSCVWIYLANIDRQMCVYVYQKSEEKICPWQVVPHILQIIFQMKFDSYKLFTTSSVRSV